MDYNRKQHAHFYFQSCAILAESEQGLTLRMPAANFRAHVSVGGINGRFSVDIDDNKKIRTLVKL